MVVGVGVREQGDDGFEVAVGGGDLEGGHEGLFVSFEWVRAVLDEFGDVEVFAAGCGIEEVFEELGFGGFGGHGCGRGLKFGFGFVWRGGWDGVLELCVVVEGEG